jgi:hypothetical protein
VPNSLGTTRLTALGIELNLDLLMAFVGASVERILSSAIDPI